MKSVLATRSMRSRSAAIAGVDPINGAAPSRRGRTAARQASTRLMVLDRGDVSETQIRPSCTLKSRKIARLVCNTSPLIQRLVDVPKYCAASASSDQPINHGADPESSP